MVSAQNLVLILTGPTASGKTSLALKTATLIPSIEIINADSLIVYRGATIGTAKPSLEKRREIPHHLIDLCDPKDTYTAGDFYRDAHAALKDIESRKKRALIVGGTGFYLKALIHGLWDAPKTDPNLRIELEKKSTPELFQELNQNFPKADQKIMPTDRYRIIRALEIAMLTKSALPELEKKLQAPADPRFFVAIIDRKDEDLQARVAQRTDQMLADGFVEEVKALLATTPDSKILSSVGYFQVANFLKGVTPTGRKMRPGLGGLKDEIILATKQLIKRQRTWFRSQTQGQSFTMDEDEEALLEKAKSIYT